MRSILIASDIPRLEAMKRRVNDLEKVAHFDTARKRFTEDELPPLQQKLQTASTEIDGLSKEVRALESSKADSDARVHAAEELGVVCHEVQQLTKTIDELKKEVRTETAKLGSIDSAKTLDEVAEELSSANDERDTLEKKRDRKRNDERDKRLAVEVAEKDRTAANETLLTAQAEAAKRTAAENTLKSLQADEKQALKEIADRRKEENPIQEKLDDATAEQGKEERDYHKKIDTARREKSDHVEKVRQIGGYTDNIERYERQGQKSAVAKSTQTIQALEGGLAIMEDDENDQRTKVEELRTEISNVESQERSIRDNLQVRSQAEELTKMQKRVNGLDADFKAANGSEIEQRRQELARKVQALEESKNMLKGQKQELAGKKKEKEKELRNPVYRDAEKTFRETHIRHKTTEMANKDLDTYYRALDRAVMQYHAIKMGEINVIIKELWQTTYQGKDIDTIEILSEDEGSTKKVDANARKTYKYRVVMVKGKVKLDMRGRCSAGQKVLSSIIIRLALAETFCLSCGILTLDEPTTNLDEANIASLAEALARIISERRKQSNFQMVVITHDEKFVRKLGIGGVADTYYKVFKNESDDGKVVSQIRRHNMRDLDP